MFEFYFWILIFSKKIYIQLFFQLLVNVIVGLHYATIVFSKFLTAYSSEHRGSLDIAYLILPDITDITHPVL